MANCNDLITQGIRRDCNSPWVRGFEKVGWIINRNDIDFSSVEFNDELANTITALPLKQNARGFLVEQAGNTPFTGSSTAIVPGTYGATVTNTINVVMMDMTADEFAGFLDPAMNGEFVIILERKYKGVGSNPPLSGPGGSTFQVFGLHQGLTLAESTNEFYSDDTLGMFPLSFVETSAPRAAMFLDAGSYEATKTLLNTIVNPV